MRIAIIVAAGLVAAASCKDERPRRRGRIPEGELAVNRLVKTLKVFHARMDAFPVGTIGRTPMQPCCAAPDHACAPEDPAWAASPIWRELEFTMTEKHHCQYSYQGTAKAFTVEAACDLDCDEIELVITATGTAAADGTVNVAVTSAGKD